MSTRRLGGTTDRLPLARANGRAPEGYAARLRQRVRARLPRILTAGIILSLCSCVVFYALLKTLHDPAIFTEYWKSISTKEWMDAYTSWSNTRLAYTQGYGISALAALGFAVTFGIYLFPRLALAASFFLLNVFFAWTSHVFATISQPLANVIINAITAQDAFLWVLVNIRYGSSTLVVADGEALVALVILTTLVFVSNLHKGEKKALLLSFQVMALCCMILGTEYLVFDSGEFFLHVTQIQASFSVATWFSNADLLFSGIAIFGVSTFLLHFRRLRLPWKLVS